MHLIKFLKSLGYIHICFYVTICQTPNSRFVLSLGVVKHSFIRI